MNAAFELKYSITSHAEFAQRVKKLNCRNQTSSTKYAEVQYNKEKNTTLCRTPNIWAQSIKQLRISCSLRLTRKQGY